MVFTVEIREVYNSLEYDGEWKRFEIRNISPIHLRSGVVESCKASLGASRVDNKVTSGSHFGYLRENDDLRDGAVETFHCSDLIWKRGDTHLSFQIRCSGASELCIPANRNLCTLILFANNRFDCNFLSTLITGSTVNFWAKKNTRCMYCKCLIKIINDTINKKQQNINIITDLVEKKSRCLDGNK